MSEKIRLEFRRGGDWHFVKGADYFYRCYGSDYEPQICCDCSGGETNPVFEYAGPFELEIVEPDPEPLRIPGHESHCWLHPDSGVFYCDALTPDGELINFRATGSTRREAIERFNILARAMGATP